MGLIIKGTIKNPSKLEFFLELRLNEQSHFGWIFHDDFPADGYQLLRWDL